MKHSGIVLGRGGKAYRKGLVLILAVKVYKRCAAFYMRKLIESGVKLGQLPLSDKPKSMFFYISHSFSP